MGPSRPVEELLRPTLDETQDPARMRDAWSPWRLTLLAFFGGPLTAGYLYGENYRRLGRAALFPWFLGGALVLVVLGGLGARYALDSGAVDAEGGEARAIRWVSRFLTVAAAIPVSQIQQRRYRVFAASGAEDGKLLRAGLFAVFVLGFAGNYLAFLVLQWTS